MVPRIQIGWQWIYVPKMRMMNYRNASYGGLMKPTWKQYRASLSNCCQPCHAMKRFVPHWPIAVHSSKSLTWMRHVRLLIALQRSIWKFPLKIHSNGRIRFATLAPCSLADIHQKRLAITAQAQTMFCQHHVLRDFLRHSVCMIFRSVRPSFL